MPASRLRWLQIHQYERFASVRIEFSPHENLLLGVNGAGKTRLLRLLRAVLNLNYSELLGTAFDLEFAVTVEPTEGESQGSVTVTGRVKNVRGPIADEREHEFRTTSEFSATIRCECAGVVVEYEVAGDDVVYRLNDLAEAHQLAGPGDLRPFLGRATDAALKLALVSTNPASTATYLGESEQEFRVLSEGLEYAFIGTRGTSANVPSNFGGSTRGHLLRDLVPLVTAFRHLAVREEMLRGLDLTWLSELRKIPFTQLFPALGMRTIKLIPKVVRLEQREVHCRGIGFESEFVDGTRMTETELTFGQQRYLYGGIVSLMHPGAAVLVDEIDNGMHPRLLETLLKLWQDRQVFLVSHNKLVIDYTDFAGPDDVQRKIHIVRRGEDGRQTVDALAEDVANEVFNKIDVGIQSPSDVLRAEGLW